MGGGRRRRIERSSSSIDRRYKRPCNSSERHRRNESRNRRARRRSWNKKNSDHFGFQACDSARLITEVTRQHFQALNDKRHLYFSFHYAVKGILHYPRLHFTLIFAQFNKQTVRCKACSEQDEFFVNRAAM
ncbi:unnamed protein product [Brugia pahangi]|uniref:E3 ubiquitin-protein ligase n=1 Tax=Brugia pahangi TaxID=6280 RepID=A0A0N4TMF0_BRUPA|nr:unnamed protein product [Brugia pahangi]